MILMFIPYVKTLGYKKQDQISFIFATVIHITYESRKKAFKVGI